MRKLKNAFSIIEIIISTMILSVAVFGVFKLISENNKIIYNSDKYDTANSLFISFIECLKNIEPDSTDKKFLQLNNCNPSNTETGIKINNNEYILQYSGTTNNQFDLLIKNDNIQLKQNFTFK